MRQIDMSAQAVTARLKLVSQLRKLCLSLQTAKIRSEHTPKDSDVKPANDRRANKPRPE
jgi:hypothetical protein